MVIFLRKEAQIDHPGGDPRVIPDMNVRDLFVLPYRMWSKLPPLQQPEPLAHPVKHVIASWTNTKECWEEWECVREMWKLQESFRDKGQDIPYNFVVGGDSNVYECRGWHAQPAKCERHPDLEGKALEIAHIGWKVEDERDPYVGMCHAASQLMDRGIEKGYLVDVKDVDFRPDYDVLHGTPWSEKNKDELQKMKEEEEKTMKEYMEGLKRAMNDPKNAPQNDGTEDMVFV